MKRILFVVCTILLAVSCTKNDAARQEQVVAEEIPLVAEDASAADGEAVNSTKPESDDYNFVSCVFDSGRDQIILSNTSGKYKLEVYLYGTYIGYGEYQVFGDEQESHLEGTLLKDGISRDLKTTLFVDRTKERIKVSGSAQLYEPHSVRKSDEILDFAYEGSLAVVPAEEEQESEQEPSLGSYGVTEEEYLASYPDISDDPDKPNMTFVEGGTFLLGSDSSGYHDVTVSSFEIGVTEVTIGQYYPVIGKTVSNGGNNNYPVCVNWFEAVIYCNKLSLKYGYEPCYSINGEADPTLWGEEVPYQTEADDVGDATEWNTVQCDFNANGFRLPTEAEWAFAAQGGNKSEHTSYSGSDDINEVGWTAKNASNSQEVAKKKPNELGLYDMSGNVWEWCWNWSAAYATEPEVNPTGPSDVKKNRVIRGGGWGTPDSYSQITYSSSDNSAVKSRYFGMRLCRSIGQR